MAANMQSGRTMRLWRETGSESGRGTSQVFTPRTVCTLTDAQQEVLDANKSSKISHDIMMKRGRKSILRKKGDTNEEG